MFGSEATFATTMIAFENIRWDGREVPVTYVSNPNGKEVDAVLLEFVSRALESWSESLPVALGIDFEWRPDFKDSNHPIAVMQLASKEEVLVVSLSRLNYKLTAAMKTLLKTGSRGLFRLVGYDLRQDSRKLAHWNPETFSRTWNVSSSHVMDLAFCPGSPARPIGLNKLSEKLLGIPGKQNHRLSVSNWSRPLTAEQVRYAARDSWAALQIYLRDWPQLS